MARPNRRQHKIPRIYLQAFTNSEGSVWVGDENFKVYPQKPENILTERDYYTIKFPTGGGTLEVETKYLNGIEGNYADIYREKINEKKELDPTEKAKMAIFVASMMQRQPMSRSSLETFFKEVTEHVTHLRGLPDRVKKQMVRLPTLPHSGPTISADEMLKMAEDVGSLHTSLIPESVPDIAPIIFDMKWSFLVRPSASEPFITSDNPCVMVNPVTEAELGRGRMGSQPGLLQNDVELTLPLSSDVALLCGWQAKYDGIYLPVDSTLVKDVNMRTKRHARTIISSDEKIIRTIIDRIKSHQTSRNK